MRTEPARPHQVALRLARWLAAASAMCLCLMPRALAAQDASPAADTPTCLRFTFGAWTPALDWKLAGHRGPADSTHVGHTPEGRGWAAPASGQNADTVLVLFPGFWPAGVSLTFDPRALSAADTVIGKATALVADANKPSPVSRARVWRVPCIAR